MLLPSMKLSISDYEVMNMRMRHALSHEMYILRPRWKHWMAKMHRVYFTACVVQERSSRKTLRRATWGFSYFQSYIPAKEAMGFGKLKRRKHV